MPRTLPFARREALEAGLSPVIVVLGFEADAVRAALEKRLAETATIAELARDTSTLSAGNDSRAVLVGRFGPDSDVREGGPVDAVVDPTTGRRSAYVTALASLCESGVVEPLLEPAA